MLFIAERPGSIGSAFVACALEHGLIVRNLQDTIALSPPLIISEQETDELLRRFERTLEQVAAGA